MLKALRNFEINNKLFIISSRTLNPKNFIFSFSLNKINSFAFSQNSAIELIKILRSETSK